MRSKKEVDILADVFEDTRLLTRFYISNLKGLDMFKEFEVDGQKINSPYWLCAHLVWSERMLILQACEGPVMEIPWVDKFGFGSKMPSRKGLPDIKEVLATMNAVHEKAMTHLRSMDDKELEEANATGVGFGEDKSKRMMIHHVIRHEGIHAGHLGLIGKMYGVNKV